jgi:hypothetical protein
MCCWASLTGVAGHQAADAREENPGQKAGSGVHCLANRYANRSVGLFTDDGEPNDLPGTRPRIKPEKLGVSPGILQDAPINGIEQHQSGPHDERITCRHRPNLKPNRAQ